MKAKLMMIPSIQTITTRHGWAAEVRARDSGEKAESDIRSAFGSLCGYSDKVHGNRNHAHTVLIHRILTEWRIRIQ